MLSFSHLAAITGGKIIQYAIEMPIRHLLLDSRKLVIHPESIFFALQGRCHNSHRFIPAVYEKGIRQFVVEQDDAVIYKHLKEANIMHVDSSIDALQLLAIHHRRQYKIPLLAITGSNGKTIVKEWLSQFLALQYPIIKSPKSYNSQIGVPQSVWLMNDGHQYGVFEAGISQLGEMVKLAAILQPTMGLFTNVGSAHDEGFATRHEKTIQKALLFQSCRKIYYCLDHTLIHQVLRKLYCGKAQLITWSLRNAPADYRITKRLRMQEKQTEIVVHVQQKRHTFIVPLQDTASVENVIHCIVFLLQEGFDPAMMQKVLMKVKAIPMRLTLKQGINNCQVIDDTYNNDLIGLQVALDFMAQQKQAARRTAILSDLLQTGVDAEKLYTQVAQLLREHKVDRLIGIGEELKAHAAAFSSLEASFYSCTDMLLQEAIQHKFSDELILVKGARPFSLEKVVAKLQQKIHSTVLEVDLDAITHNLNFFRSKLAHGVQLMAVVKAFAYGNSSSFEIAQLLQYHRIDCLAVAYADEGALLRTHGITLPILVMNPTPESFDKLLSYDLMPEIYSLKMLQALRAFLMHRNKAIPIHLKLETGMHRLGFEEGELDRLVQLLRITPALRVVGVMSHLAAAADPQHDVFTRQQIALFTSMAAYIEQSLGMRVCKHLLSSAGIIRFPAYQLDMVRLGIGLYGVGVNKVVQQHLKVASTFKTVISQLKSIPQGATVGYGRKGVAKQPMQIAVLAVGYADGFDRVLGNGRGCVWVNGHLAPTIGDICMDMSMIDVTGIPTTEGDEVILFGHQLPIAQVADAMHTIPYEVLTGVRERVKRVYYIS